MTAALTACFRGEISPPVAVARMVLDGLGAVDILSALEAARSGAPDSVWNAVHALVVAHAPALDALRTTLRQEGSDQARLGNVAAIASFFDRLAGTAPEAAVALYSLGDPAILAAATAELTAWLVAERLIWPGAKVLDLGCGIGRVAASLAAKGAAVLGVDVSHAMVAEAQRRHTGQAGLRFEVTDGSAVPLGPWDLVLLADTMPYIHQARLADATLASIAGRLRPGGTMAILNLSYGRESPADPADAGMWASRHGWSWAESRPFKLWDARAFVFRNT